MVHDPYQVLNIPRDASRDEIKKAYRRMAKQYHPDLHPGDPVAAQKMNEVNEAYDMLMNPEKYANAKTGSQRQSNPGYQGPGGWASDFGGFGGFEDFFFGGAQTEPLRQQPDDSMELRRAVTAINSRQFLEALNILNTVQSTGRNARWYYLSARANYAAGNHIMALDQMQRACQLDPSNITYRRTLQMYRQAGQAYQQYGQGFHVETSNLTKLCVGCCAAQFLFRLCCLWF